MINSFPTGLLYLFINATFLTFFISIGEFHRAFSQHYCDAVNVMKDATYNSARNQEIKRMFHNLIQIHVSVKKYVISGASQIITNINLCRYFRFFQETASLYSYLILMQLMCGHGFYGSFRFSGWFGNLIILMYNIETMWNVESKKKCIWTLCVALTAIVVQYSDQYPSCHSWYFCL